MPRGSTRMKTSSGRRSGYCMKIGIADSGWLAGWVVWVGWVVWAGLSGRTTGRKRLGLACHGGGPVDAGLGSLLVVHWWSIGGAVMQRCRGAGAHPRCKVQSCVEEGIHYCIGCNMAQARVSSQLLPNRARPLSETDLDMYTLASY
jgi:hypothetical protein